jgi:hypothetical protein
MRPFRHGSNAHNGPIVRAPQNAAASLARPEAI